MLKHVTIASGGVIPRIHPELLVRKKGGKIINLSGPKATLAKPVVPVNKPIPSKAAATPKAKAADKGSKKKGAKKSKGAVCVLH